jgi:hypothetical protein
MDPKNPVFEPVLLAQESEIPDHIKWMIAEIMRELRMVEGTMISIPVMFGIINALCHFIPDMGTAISIRTAMGPLISQSKMLWLLTQQSHGDTKQ